MNAEQMFSELGYKKCDECISPVYINTIWFRIRIRKL